VRAVIRQVMLHSGPGEGYDAAVAYASRLAHSVGADLHVVYTIDEPLSAGWTAEMSAANLPELHQAMEEEAREQLARALPQDLESRATVAIRTGDPAAELVRYTTEHTIDLAIVQGSDRRATALYEDGRCSVLILRPSD
jgi:hypothetical protein